MTATEGDSGAEHAGDEHAGDGTGPAGSEPRSRPWVRWVRIVVSLALLAVLVTRLHFDELLPKHPGARTIIALACGIAVTFLGVVLSAWRWKRVLVTFEAPLPLRTLLSVYLAGMFLGNVLPSTIGGDVLRIKRCSDLTGSGEIGFGSVILERLTGWLALPVVSLTGFAIDRSLVDEKHAWIAIWTSIGALVLLFAILFLAGHPRLAGRFHGNENWTRFIGAVHFGVDRMRRHPRLALGVLVAALLYACSTVVTVGLAVETLGLDIPTAALVAYVPAVAMLQVLPLSLSGLGIREGMLVLLLRPLGVSTGSAVAVGLLWYAMTVAVSLLGAPSLAIGTRRRPVSATAPPTPSDGH